MAFVADLRAYLEAVERGEAGALPAPLERVDEHRLRAHFLSRLRELEDLGGPFTEAGSRFEIGSLFEYWSLKIPSLARYVERLPSTMTERGTGQVLAERIVDMALAAPVHGTSRVEILELRRILHDFRDGRPVDLATYSLETGLVREAAGGAREVTQLGTVFLRLRGVDAVRWLLTVEITQSTGYGDEWRTSRQLLEAAASKTGIPTAAEKLEPLFPFDRRLLERLTDTEALVAIVDDRERVLSYRAAEDWLDVIHAVVVPGPWHRAIAAILEDVRSGAIPSGGGASEAVVDQAKMIAHEVRNALIPVRHHLDTLRASAGLHSERVDAARRGVVRVLTFAEEMVATSELVAEAATLCDLAAAVREALGWLDAPAQIADTIADVSVRVMAPRSQLTRVIANVLRNALQATPETQRVRIGIVQLVASVRVTIDDGGPGIPLDERDRVFQQGYTTRPDGSGYGLAYVRRVTDELRGRVWCEDSDLGGARFVIELPSDDTPR